MARWPLLNSRPARTPSRFHSGVIYRTRKPTSRITIQPSIALRRKSRRPCETILDEVLKVRSDFIEDQLAHAVRDPNGRAYNRTALLPERRKMMQLWADYLDELKSTQVAAPRHPWARRSERQRKAPPVFASRARAIRAWLARRRAGSRK
jgi:hypothetical protein